MDAKRHLKLSIKGPVYKQVGALKRGLKIARIYRRNVSGRINLLPGTKLWPVSFNKRQQSEEAFFPENNIHCIQCQFLFPRCKLRLRYTGGNFNKNPSMRTFTKILRARVSEHSSNFCEQFEQRPNLRALSN